MDIAFQLVSGVVLLLIGAVLGVFANEGLKRPKPVVSGAGSSASATEGHAHVRIENRPANLGLRIRETIVLGKPVHREFWRGFPVDRNPARNCIAWLKDDKGNYITTLSWRQKPGEPMSPHRTLESGEGEDLFLFGYYVSEPGLFFVYQFNLDGTMKQPPNGARLEPQTFEVELQWADGQAKRSFKYEVAKTYDGRLTMRHVP